MKTYKVTITDRNDITNKHYQVEGGLSKEEVLERFNITQKDFDEALESGYLGKDGISEYDIVEE